MAIIGVLPWKMALDAVGEPREALHWMGMDPGHVIFEPGVAEHLRECGRQQGDRLRQHEQ